MCNRQTQVPPCQVNGIYWNTTWLQTAFRSGLEEYSICIMYATVSLLWVPFLFFIPFHTIPYHYHTISNNTTPYHTIAYQIILILAMPNRLVCNRQTQVSPLSSIYPFHSLFIWSLICCFYTCVNMCFFKGTKYFKLKAMRSAIFIGPRCPWGPIYGSWYPTWFADLTDATLADEDSNSIPTDDVNRAI